MLPNKQPLIDHPDYRLAIITDYPDRSDVNDRKLLGGAPGQLVDRTLSRLGITRVNCFLGSVYPEAMDFMSLRTLSWTDATLQASLARLRSDLQAYRPHCILGFGNLTLKAALDPDGPLGKTFKDTVNEYRGSRENITHPNSPFFGFEFIATYEPRMIPRMFEWLPLFRFDVARAVNESTTPTYTRPIRNFNLAPTPQQIIDWIESIPAGAQLSVDIEGGIVAFKKTRQRDEDGNVVQARADSFVPCLALSTDPSSGIIIDFTSLDAHLPTYAKVVRALSRVLSDRKIGKVLQNGLYDAYVLAHFYNIYVFPIVHDTMIKGFVMNPELPKSLGVQASIWTLEPFWKNTRQTTGTEFHLYCCKDAAVTLEISQAQGRALTPTQRSHYNFTISLLPVMLYMSLRGMRWDQDLADRHVAAYENEMAQITAWLRAQHPDNETVNLNSPAQLNTYLYKTLNYPPQYKLEGGRKTNKLTSDKKALLKLLVKFKDPIITRILRWKKLKRLCDQAGVQVDPDSRIRSTYNLVGAKTARVSNAISPTGHGFNLQTGTKSERCLFAADPDHYFFQVDLSGADGWTVAARCAEAGDNTMLEDYRAGIKPARVIALNWLERYDRAVLKPFYDLYGPTVASWSREDLLTVSLKAPIPDWLYFACKRVQHGSNYGLGKITMANQILEDSYKLFKSPIEMRSADCEELKQCYLNGRYYGVVLWQESIKQKLIDTGAMTCVSGFTRIFNGPRRNHKTINSALSHEPQHMTTYVTNRALHNMFYDPENRYTKSEDGIESFHEFPPKLGSLIVEPLHQMHDAICGQFRKCALNFARRKFREWLDVPVVVAGQTLRISYEGGYGDSWGDTEHPDRQF